MKNNLWRTFVLVLLVVAVLLGLFYLPRIKVFDTELRRVNILSDVQHRNREGKILAEVKADSLDGIVEEKIDSAAIQVKELAYTDSIPVGMIAIEDFADTLGLNREMDDFYAALDETSHRPVRIAYFGDSYIEGDIITMDLRGLLQQKYGGCGVGFVEIQCIASDFRQSIITKRDDWNSYYANEPARGFRAALQGIAGSYFIPNSSATYEMRGTKRFYPNQLDTAEVATVYFTSGEGLNIHYALNGGENQQLFSNGTPIEPETYEEIIEERDSDSVAHYTTVVRQVPQEQIESNSVLAKSVNGHIGKFAMQITGGGSSRFYGVALDGHRGISVDNFSMRGSSGSQLLKVPQATLKSFAKVRSYDLIILHYGLNVASAQQKNYSAYASQMGKVVQHLKETNPHASILIVSIADRDARGDDGEMHTMEGVRELVSYQRKMASDQHIAFWNLYEAMGGDGSLAKMTEKNLANKDYTHINFAGGRQLAKLLFDVLMNGKENYDRRAHE